MEKCWVRNSGWGIWLAETLKVDLLATLSESFSLLPPEVADRYDPTWIPIGYAKKLHVSCETQ